MPMKLNKEHQMKPSICGSANSEVKGLIICEKAVFVDKQLDADDKNIEASSGWLNKFKHRHGMRSESQVTQLKLFEVRILFNALDRPFHLILRCGYLSDTVTDGKSRFDRIIIIIVGASENHS